MEDKFSLVDEIINKVNKEKIEPLFTEEVHQRLNRDLRLIDSDDLVFKSMAKLIAYSQNARSNIVDSMLQEGLFEKIFCNHNIEQVSQLDSKQVEDQYWDQIKMIRFKKKISSIIGCSISLKLIQAKYGSFKNLIHDMNIPFDNESQNDIDSFWIGFNRLKKELIDFNIPFFRSTTTLLHLLLHIGFDCIKPDLIVMTVAKDLDIVQSIKGNTNLIKVVQFVQNYSLKRTIKPSIVDFYLLIHGGQLWARRFVNSSYYNRK